MQSASTVSQSVITIDDEDDDDAADAGQCSDRIDRVKCRVDVQWANQERFFHGLFNRQHIFHASPSNLPFSMPAPAAAAAGHPHTHLLALRQFTTLPTHSLRCCSEVVDYMLLRYAITATAAAAATVAVSAASWHRTRFFFEQLFAFANICEYCAANQRGDNLIDCIVAATSLHTCSSSSSSTCSTVGILSRWKIYASLLYLISRKMV